MQVADELLVLKPVKEKPSPKQARLLKMFELNSVSICAIISLHLVCVDSQCSSPVSSWDHSCC